MHVSRIKILLFTLALAAVALWLTSQAPQNLGITHQPPKKTLSYSWQASNTTIWNLKPSDPGKQSVVQAQSIAYKDNEQSSEYIKPHVEIIEPSGLSTITSQAGESQEDKILRFKDQVVITQQPKDPKQPPIRLSTDKINYNLHTNQLTTDAKVTITQYNGQTTGTGLKANLKTSDLILYSDVNGIYYPQKMHKPVQAKEP